MLSRFNKEKLQLEKIDLLMSFLEIQKVKDLKIGKKNHFTSQIVSNYLNLTKFKESLSCQPID